MDKDAVEHFKALCSENGIAFQERGAHNSYLVKFAVEDKNNVMGVKIG